ncbi:AI-2E family transporter [Microbacterium aoyamense]|uniref:AI-2E family transporter n=1 Tax=Microbacterium aoyamense TaxID=344166 RepID=A0ABN2PIN1_9MICO|nr:AI-2E family transporter [Microbacterium aoyamense]
MSNAPESSPVAPTAPTAPVETAPVEHRRSVLATIQGPLVLAFIATLGVLGGLVLGSAIGSITTILVYIVLALFVALGLDPVVRSLERRGVRRGVGIAIVFIVFALLVAAVAVFVLPPVIAQVGELVRSIPQGVKDIVDSGWFRSLPEDFQATVTVGLAQIAEGLARPETIAAIGGGVLLVGIGFVSAVSAGFIIVALTLYFLASLTGMKEALYSLAPAHSRPKLRDMTERVTKSVGSSLLGSVVLSVINAGVVLLLHIVIGLPFPALMAAIAFVITLIPLFGSVIFLFLGTTVALFTSPTQALIFAVCYLVYIQLESYVVSPRVMTRAIQIPAALVLIGAMVGGALMGIIGVLVALPVMASILLVIREVVVPKQDLKV